jgi:hypothetical protein
MPGALNLPLAGGSKIAEAIFGIRDVFLERRLRSGLASGAP